MTTGLLPTERRAVHDAVTTACAGLVIAGVMSAVLAGAHPTSTTTVWIAAVVGPLPALLATVVLLCRRPRSSTPADRVTLGRAVLASGCAAITVMVVVGAAPARTWWLLCLVVPTLLLDRVDGIVARRTGTVTPAGASLDMEVDAVVLLVISVAVASDVGRWVLLIGAMRYLYVIAAWARPELRGTLPRSTFRVAAAALQGVALAVAIAPVVPVTLAHAVLLLALGMLVASFVSEIFTKERLCSSRAVTRTRVI